MYHSFVIDSNHNLWCCGSNKDKQLGFSNYKKIKNFSKVKIATNTKTNPIYFKSVFTRGCSTMALDENGDVWVAGDNLYNKLLCEAINVSRFHKIPQIRNIEVISCGTTNSILIDDNQKAWVSGLSYLDKCENLNNFHCVEPNESFKGASCGLNFVILLDVKGTVWCSGDNRLGQLGFGKIDNLHHFEKIDYLKTPLISVSCGHSFSVILDAEGHIWTAGSNRFGQLGLGKNILGIRLFHKIQDKNIFVSISCGDRHMTALDKNGFIWCTGDNNFGQLGLGDNECRFNFTPVSLSDSFISVSCGGEHTLALDENNILFVAGNNSHSQLGISSIKNTNRLTPVFNSELQVESLMNL